MNRFFKQYRSTLNTIALVLLLAIPFILYAAVAQGRAILVPALAAMAGVMLLVLKSG